MIALASTFKKAYWSLGIVGVIYGGGLLALANPWFFRTVFYMNLLKLDWGIDINHPEEFGFAKNQITPFNLSTPDGETLYAWHILPASVYAKHEEELLQQQRPSATRDVISTPGFHLLANDPEARLIIKFHGNTGTVVQGWRTDTYRALSYGSTPNVHVLTIDYRGFGFSTGFPTETGMIMDGVTAVNWAIDVAKVPPERIVIVGQSLGTAVTAAVADHFAERGVEFAGIVMIASFTTAPNVLNGYKVGGVLPVLSALRGWPRLLKWIQLRVVDTWDTASRIANFVKKSNRVRLFLIHALDDDEIPCSHTDVLFSTAANATIHGGMSLQQLSSMKNRSTIDTGGGAYISTWNGGGDKIIREEIVGYGHHDRVMTSVPVALAVLKAFDFGTASGILTQE